MILEVVDLPDKYREVYLAYRAFKDVETEADIDLGKCSDKGLLLYEHLRLYRERFYQFLDPIKDKLPEIIPLRYGSSDVLKMPIKIGKENYNFVISADSTSYYYLPRTDERYNIDPPFALSGFKPEPIDPRLIPENPNFLGFEHIRERGALHARMNQIRTGVSQGWKVRGKIIEDYYNELSLDEITTILANAESNLTGADDIVELRRVQADLDELKKDYEQEKEDLERQYSFQLKTRIINLTRIVISMYGNKALPQFIENGYSIEVKQTRFFLPFEERVILGPRVLTGNWLIGKKEIPDLKRCQEGSYKEWLRIGNLVSDIIKPIPQNIRNYFDRFPEQIQFI